MLLPIFCRLETPALMPSTSCVTPPSAASCPILVSGGSEPITSKRPSASRGGGLAGLRTNTLSVTTWLLGHKGTQNVSQCTLGQLVQRSAVSERPCRAACVHDKSSDAVLKAANTQQRCVSAQAKQLHDAQLKPRRAKEGVGTSQPGFMHQNTTTESPAHKPGVLRVS